MTCRSCGETTKFPCSQGWMPAPGVFLETAATSLLIAVLFVIGALANALGTGEQRRGREEATAEGRLIVVRFEADPARRRRRFRHQVADSFEDDSELGVVLGVFSL